ncbi:MAG: histidine kinase [Bifidobacterium sp.]|uniref:sensor histidine kinase n=1 Tax=Bifidobacterium sp. TaxID=41200 RepID=UPI0039EC72E8
MMRGAYKFVLWLLCISLAMLRDGSSLSVAFVFAIFVSLSAAALSEWLAPHRLAACCEAALAVLALAIPQMIAFLPLFSFDVASAMARWCMLQRRPDASLDKGAFSLRAYWIEYGMCACIGIAVMASLGLGTAFAVEPAMLRLTLLCLCALNIFSGFALTLIPRMRRRALLSQDEAREIRRRMRNEAYDAEDERRNAMREATLAERTRIAREIHDGVGHLLTRGIMQSHTSQVVASMTGDETNAQGFRAIKDTFAEAMNAVRQTVHDLDDSGNDFALQIGSAAKVLQSVAQGPEVTLENEIQQAPAPVTRCLAMTVRESLNNVLRHSDARHVEIVLRDMPALWQLVVQDDGSVRQDEARNGSVGPRQAVRDIRGMGLADIESRARELGGNALCGPNARGWRVFVSLPKAPWSNAGGVRHQEGHVRDERDPHDVEVSGNLQSELHMGIDATSIMKGTQ